MDSLEIKKFMKQCFMGMMALGKLSDDGFLSSLNSIVYVLKESGNITEEQKEECILEFFIEYNKGCGNGAMSQEYIKETLIPHILNLRTIDISDASFYIDNAFKLM